MRTFLLLVIIFLSAITVCFSRHCVPCAFAAEQTSRAGWYGILPHIDGYRKTFSAPHFSSSDGWMQMVRFQQLKHPNKSVNVVISSVPMKLNYRQFVKLGDKGAIIAFKPAGLDDSEFQAFVKKFDTKGISRAVQKPPRQNFELKKSTFAAIPKGANYLDVLDWVGESSDDIGSGIYIKAYKLADGGRALVGTSDLKNVMYVNIDGR